MTIDALKKSLGEHFDKLQKLFDTAFSLIDRAIGGADVYVVFIARRCFILACVFLRALIPSIGEDLYAERQRHIYSDGGLRILAKYLARKFFINDNFRCKIYMIDDIMIHGRAVGGLLSAAEEIFAQEYLTLRDLNPGKGQSYTKSQLYDIFLGFIVIKTGYTSTQPNLLRVRYRRRMDSESTTVAEPRRWRDASNRIAELIFNGDIPNAAFTPGILFNGRSFINKKIIYSHFNKVNNDSNSALSKWVYIRNEYKDREMDSYMMTVPSYKKISSVFSIRCTDSYMMPFVFLPMMDSEAIDHLERAFLRKLSSAGYDDLLEFFRFMYGLKVVEKLSNMYAELITTVYSVSLLRAFLSDIGLERSSYFNDISVDEHLIRNTTLPIIMGNYAHIPAVKKLMVYLLDPESEPLFTLDEISDLVSGRNENDRLVISGGSYHYSHKAMDPEVRKKFISHLEKVVFEYGMESEAEAYRLSTGLLAPSYESVEYFYFPNNNNLENVLQSIYSEEADWMSNRVSVYDTFSYILQMMDYGSLSLITGRNDSEMYLQCLKAGEQSLNAEAKKYTILLPLMHEIEERCSRKGRPTFEAFSDELVYFNDFAFFYIDDTDSELIHEAYDLLQDEDVVRNLLGFESWLYRAGHSNEDYMFTLNDMLRDNGRYEGECHDFYYQVIY